MKLAFGILSIIPAIFAYYSYFKQMFRGKTKPHAFSWLVWGILSGIGFFAQVGAHAGIGAWAAGMTSVASLTICAVSFGLGTTRPTRFDWTMLALALTSLALLFVANSPVVALCLTLFALVAGFSMTIRKAYHRPHEENALSFWLNTLKFVPAIFALASFSFLTVAYPLVAALGNLTIALVIYIRGHQQASAQSQQSSAA